MDSLLNNLESAKEDTNQVLVLNELAHSLYRSEMTQALGYAERSLLLSEKLNFKRGMPAALNIIAILNQYQGNYHKAITFYSRSQEILMSLGEMAAYGNSFNNLGIIYYQLGDYPEALKSFFSALKVQEDIGDEIGMSKTYNSIGVVQNEMGDDSLTLEYYLKSLRLLEKLNDRPSMSTLYNNIGIIHDNHDNDSLAMDYFVKAVRINSELGNKRGLAMNYNNIGSNYASREEYEAALTYQLKALRIQEELGNIEDVLFSLSGIGEVYGKKGMAKQAISYYSRCVDLALQINNLNRLMEAHKYLALAYELDHDYKSAYLHHHMFSNIKDSLFSEESNLKMTEMEAKYQSAKKEQEITFLEKENEVKALELDKESKLRYYMGGSFLFILLITSLLYNRYRIKQKKDSLEEKQVLLNQINQHQESMIFAIVNAQEEERERIAKELHDGLGGLLSTVKLNLDNFKSKYIPLKEQNEVLLTKSIDLVDDVCADLRTVSHDMMPGVLVKLGLPAGIKDFMGTITGSGKPSIEIDIVGLEERLDGKTEVIIYRVIQEAVNNIIKHAEASTINLQLVKHENEISVIIEDDGKGFDVKANSNGVGLKNMESRVKFLGGKIIFDSTSGRGTSVILEIPV